MVSSGYGQGNGTLDAFVLCLRGGGFDASGAAAEHDLSGSVQVCHIHLTFGSELANGGFLTTEHGDHRSLGVVTGLFHEAATLKDELQAGGEVKGARRRMCGEFAERKAGRGGDLELRHLRFEHFEEGEAVRIQGGLAAAGLRQIFHRAFKHHLGQREAERGIRLVEQAADFGKGLGEVLSHADFLSALTGEEDDCGE